MTCLAWVRAIGMVVGVLGCFAVSGCDAPVPDAPVPPADIKPLTAAIPISNIIANNDFSGTNISTDISVCDCDDFNPCTIDSCPSKGGCDHQPVLCKQGICTTTACNRKSGLCEDTGPANEGGTCNDADACTQSDTCQAGVCKGAAVSCNDSNVCTTDACDPASGMCTNANVADGKTCADANVCNGAEVCKSGACAAGTALVCDDANVCTDDSCDPTAGCKRAYNTVGCDDGKACTYGERCAMGACGGGTAVVCADDTCNARSCNGTATCTAVPKVGTACDDGKDCTFTDMCNDQGRCGGVAITCTNDATTIRSCNNTNKCTETPRTGAPCDDANPCTKDDALRSDGACMGTPYTCAVTACVSANVCDGKGGCKLTPKADGTGCDADNNRCTPNDVCKAGACVADASPVACVAKDCNDVACDPATGNCKYQPKSGGDCGVTGCYSKGVCNAGVCSGQPKDCSAWNGACSDGICNAETGQCLSGPKPNGTSCATGAACATGAVCAFGVCELAPMICPAANGPCAVASCDAKTGQCGQSARPVGSPCDAANSCVTGATCTADGTCVGAPAPNGDPCTTSDGQLGVCAFGSCAASGGGETPAKDAGAVDAPSSGGGAGGAGGAVPKKDSSGGCQVSGRSSSLPGVLMLLVALGLLRKRSRAQR